MACIGTAEENLKAIRLPGVGNVALTEMAVDMSRGLMSGAALYVRHALLRPHRFTRFFFILLYLRRMCIIIEIIHILIRRTYAYQYRDRQ